MVYVDTHPVSIEEITRRDDQNRTEWGLQISLYRVPVWSGRFDRYPGDRQWEKERLLDTVRCEYDTFQANTFKQHLEEIDIDL